MAITDLALSFTPIAGGAFPDGYASRLAGGLHTAATLAARNAIPSYRREEGMECFVIADQTKYRLKAAPWVNTDADWEPVATGGTEVLTYEFPMAGSSTDMTSSSPESMGMVRFDADDFDPPGKTRVVWLEVALETSNAAHSANFDVWDYEGITNGGTPVAIPPSLGTNATVATLATFDLSAQLGTAGVGLLEGRLWTNPGPAFATCRMARLRVTWT